jgi:carboxyl-terminal processing protease
MLNSETGYIKLNKFAVTTEKEFYDGLAKFNNTKLKNIVIDLRGNPGGVMQSAVAIANQFLEGQKLVVYMQGRKTPREDFNSTGTGLLRNMKIVILTDEGSASASEILAGAIQDWDRGVIIGRRTFGKGLVQQGYYLNDGSQVRLTVARYYTPTGRSIQSPYKDGYDKYMEDYMKRFSNGESTNAGKINFPDSLSVKTLVKGRKVYGGGGIMPDVFIAADTAFYTNYYGRLVNKGVFNSFTLDYADRNRKKILQEYRSFENFKEKFSLTQEETDSFIKAGEAAGVKFVKEQYDVSAAHIHKILKALIANDLWQTTEYFRIVNEGDTVIKRALEILGSEAEYNKILGF